MFKSEENMWSVDIDNMIGCLSFNLGIFLTSLVSDLQHKKQQSPMQQKSMAAATTMTMMIGVQPNFATMA